MCEREDWLPLVGAEPAVQAHALPRNRTGNVSLWGTTPHPRSHTSQGAPDLPFSSRVTLGRLADFQTGLPKPRAGTAPPSESPRSLANRA